MLNVSLIIGSLRYVQPWRLSLLLLFVSGQKGAGWKGRVADGSSMHPSCFSLRLFIEKAANHQIVRRHIPLSQGEGRYTRVWFNPIMGRIVSA